MHIKITAVNKIYQELIKQNLISRENSRNVYNIVLKNIEEIYELGFDVYDYYTYLHQQKGYDFFDLELTIELMDYACNQLDGGERINAWDEIDEHINNFIYDYILNSHLYNRPTFFFNLFSIWIEEVYPSASKTEISLAVKQFIAKAKRNPFDCFGNFCIEEVKQKLISLI
jgi:hypothetical protein